MVSDFREACRPFSVYRRSKLSCSFVSLYSLPLSAREPIFKQISSGHVNPLLIDCRVTQVVPEYTRLF